MFNKIFRKRRILVITDEKIKNYPLSSSTQALLFFGVFGFISWVSFSSGQYFSYKQIVSKKEAEVYQANLINLDLQTKIDNLQSNLVKLNEYFSTVKEFDYNKDKGSKKSDRKNISYNGLMDINLLISRNGNVERSPLINLRGLPLHDQELNEIKYELEDKILDICRSYSLNNKKQENNLIDNLKNSLRKILQSRLSKKPFTNINLIRL